MKNIFRTFLWCMGINLLIFGNGLAARVLCDIPNHNHNFALLKITLIGSLIALIIAIISDYRIGNNHKDSVKMKFSYFRDTYYINPEAWALPGQIIRGLYHASGNIDKLRYVKSVNCYNQIYYIKFSFIDWLKFRAWMIQYKWDELGKEAQEEEEKEAQRLAEIIAAMQADVNKAYDNIKKGCSTKNKEVPLF